MANSTVHDLAPSSRRNFKTHVKVYVTFCMYFNLDMFPTDVLQEQRYLQYLSEFHASVESSKHYVGGMHSLHQIYGFELLPADDYMYQLTANGIKREKGHVVKQAAPLTPQILVGISQLVKVREGEQFTAWIALLSGFDLLLRKSNLVPESSVQFSPLHQLAHQNFVRMRDCYVVLVYWSKTIQFKERCLEIPLLPNPDKRLCPVFWLDYYFSVTPAAPTDPAFSLKRGGGIMCLLRMLLELLIITII